MNEQLIQSLRLWAAEYNTRDFIKDDPIQFPHRFERKQDIEISAFLTAWISYGRRPMILSKAEELHSLMGESPYRFIRDGTATFHLLEEKASRPGTRNTFYRFYTYGDLHMLCLRLQQIYDRHESLEDALLEYPEFSPVEKLQHLFAGIKGIPAVNGTSACKRLAMFLRWMVRTDGIVDFGIWKKAITPRELLIPLDTHVYQLSLKLGLTVQKTATLRTAKEITNALSVIFPEDPCLGDFALFGYDINNSKLVE